MCQRNESESESECIMYYVYVYIYYNTPIIKTICIRIEGLNLRYLNTIIFLYP